MVVDTLGHGERLLGAGAMCMRTSSDGIQHDDAAEQRATGVRVECPRQQRQRKDQERHHQDLRAGAHLHDHQLLPRVVFECPVFLLHRVPFWHACTLKGARAGQAAADHGGKQVAVRREAEHIAMQQLPARVLCVVRCRGHGAHD